MKTIGVILHERYSLFERLLRGSMRLVAFGFLAIVDIRFIPFIILAVALNFISEGHGRHFKN